MQKQYFGFEARRCGKRLLSLAAHGSRKARKHSPGAANEVESGAKNVGAHENGIGENAY